MKIASARRDLSAVTHPHVIQALCAVTTEEHFLNYSEDALAVGLEGVLTFTVEVDIPSIEHVMRRDERCGGVT